ncbi:hypothetical protein EDB86DRAFT_503246 [Lactarius hatsudake]|nr:hypothetical protein EDB86DRAFT_503246 [Lactarius hatsudake]
MIVHAVVMLSLSFSLAISSWHPRSWIQIYYSCGRPHVECELADALQEIGCGMWYRGLCSTSMQHLYLWPGSPSM